MEIIEVVPGVKFEHPVELPSSSVRPSSKSVGHKSSGNGTRKARNPLTPVVTGKLAAELAAEARKVTEANRMIMVVSPAGKRTFVRLSQYRAA